MKAGMEIVVPKDTQIVDISLSAGASKEQKESQVGIAFDHRL